MDKKWDRRLTYDDRRFHTETAARGSAEAPPTGPLGTDGETEEGRAGAAGDRNVAAVAHASVLLTLMSAGAGGVGALVALVVPWVIYLAYRERSRFVGFQALQALVYQGVGVLTYLVIAVALALLVTVVWIITGLLSAVAVGFLLVPAALVVTGLMVVVLLGAPLVWMAYGLYAAYQVHQGGMFRYWLLGEWLEREVRD